MNQVTKHDALEAINRLSAIHRRPDNPEAVAAEWVKAMAGVGTVELEVAVDAYLRDGGQFFPKPAQIRKLAMGSRPETGTQIPNTLYNRYLRWENDHEGPCPVCGAVLKELSAKARQVPPVAWSPKAQKLVETPDEESIGPDRAGVIHDQQKHEAQRIPAVGYTNYRPTRPTPGVGEHRDRSLTESLR